VTATTELAPGLESLKPRAIWAVLRRQSPSFFLVLLYLFFEYVRPQTIYESLAGPPWARIVIVMALFAFVLERNNTELGVVEWMLAFFALIVIASSIGAFYPDLSWEWFPRFFPWLLIYFLIANVVNTEDRFLIFMLTFLLYSFKMSQFGTRSWAMAGFQFREWGASGAPGFFQNSGEFGIQMCIFLPLMVSFNLALGPHWKPWQRWVGWAIAATAVTAIVGSSSRGAVLGAVAVGLWMLAKSRHRTRGFFIALAVAIVVYLIIPPEQKARFEAMGSDPTSLTRTAYWKHGLEMMRDYPILGIGFGNWSRYHAVMYGRGLLAHNIFIQAGAELGVTGLLAFVALIVWTFVLNRDTRRVAGLIPERGRFAYYMAHGLDGAMVGFLVSGFFVTVLYYPYFWINLAMTVALNRATRGAAMPTPAVVPGWRSIASQRYGIPTLRGSS
jgi:O-antigen ligase